ncbi:uncharacterized protein PFLUO_LOCUS4167 [Penicillium psychrofluorescens]|uniref:uncharacterized protein n=1 Tax=Penicillium psychrofluorescens TaxID=3158075 RepID=UPI003CCD7824
MAPRNVILMVADDLGKQLGCYGGTCCTPHLDKLASEGTRFTRGFASTASCSGSRSTIYTGLHTHQNGQYGLNHSKYHFVTFDHVDTIPKLLNDHGYLTGVIGKVHVGPDAVYPWQVRQETTSQTRDVARVSDRCGDFFDQARVEDKPFFLTVGFVDPHRDLTRDGFGNNDDFDKRVSKRPYRAEDVEIPKFLTDLPETRQEFANYYESINRLDQGVGMIMDRLEKAGLEDDTLVIFMSDNGPPFLNSKTTLYDSGISLPLIVRCPGRISAINPNMVSWVDIVPTILDWTENKAELRKSWPRLGRSFLGILSETETLPDWERVYGSHTFHESTNYWPTRYVRTGRFKYHRNIAYRLDFPFAADIYGSLTWEGIRNQEGDAKKVGERLLKDYFWRPPEELYDLDEDHLEVRNLAKDSAMQSVVEELRADLEAFQRRSEDLWLYRDGVSIYGAKYLLEQGMEFPDRWELDVNNLETKGPKAPQMYKHLSLGEDAPKMQ